MEVYILFECFDQSSFTDYDRVAVADPARVVVGIYTDHAKAIEEKERLEANPDPENGEETYYEIETHKVTG